MPAKTVVGVNIGGTRCSVSLGVVGDGECEIRERVAFATAQHSPQTAVARLSRIAVKLVREARSESLRVEAVGISCGGPLDAEAGVILSPPNLPGWDEIRIKDILNKETGLPARLLNDADAGALAEWRFGAARGCRNVIFLTHGTGMGAGLILDGKLYSGAHGMAGEVGHWRLAEDGPEGYGKRGSFEGFCSGGGIARLAAEMAGARARGGTPPPAWFDASAPPDARALAEKAKAGDPFALEVWRTSGRWLGRAIAGLVDLLDPEVVVLGSIYARSGGLLEAAMRAELEAEALPRPAPGCRIVPAALGERLGDCAALAAAVS